MKVCFAIFVPGKKACSESKLPELYTWCCTWLLSRVVSQTVWTACSWVSQKRHNHQYLLTRQEHGRRCISPTKYQTLPNNSAYSHCLLSISFLMLSGRTVYCQCLYMLRCYHQNSGMSPCLISDKNCTPKEHPPCIGLWSDESPLFWNPFVW